MLISFHHTCETSKKSILISFAATNNRDGGIRTAKHRGDAPGTGADGKGWTFYCEGNQVTKNKLNPVLF